MKQVIQLDSNGYAIGFSIADESPLEPGAYLIPKNCVDAELPTIPEAKLAKWTGDQFVLEDIPVIIEQTTQQELTYYEKREAEYPNIKDQLDMLYWDKMNQTSTWEDSITKIKTKYPKP